MCSPAHNLPKDDEKLLRPIRAIASQDSIAARAALNEINDILESPERHAAMRDYEDLYITSICMQFKVRRRSAITKCVLQIGSNITHSRSIWANSRPTNR